MDEPEAYAEGAIIILTTVTDMAVAI